MSKDTIAEKSLTIRIETEPGMNTNKRVADVLDDINETMLEAPKGTGFYYMATGGMQPQWTPINPSSYFLVLWNGSSFQSSNVFYHQNTQRVGIGTGNTNLNYLLEVNGSAKVNSLVVANPVNAQGDSTFNKTFVGKPDGTVGWEPKVSLGAPRANMVQFGTGGAINVNNNTANLVSIISYAGVLVTIDATSDFGSTFNNGGYTITVDKDISTDPVKMVNGNGKVVIIMRKNGTREYVGYPYSSTPLNLPVGTRYIVGYVTAGTTVPLIYLVEL